MPRIPISYKIERLAEKGLSLYQISLALNVSHTTIRRRMIPGWREASSESKNRHRKSLRRGKKRFVSYILSVLATSRTHARARGHIPCLAPLDVVFLAWTGYCHVCGVEHIWDNGSAVKLCLDHCHITGAFRGWLCHSCNSSIGHARESADRLDELSEYMRKEPIWSPKVATPTMYAHLATVPS